MNALIAILLVLLTALPLFAQSDGERISAVPLQYKLDRLYFGCGVEERIYAESQFTVNHGSRTIYSGCIQSSDSGISISYPTGQVFDTLPLADLRIEIERAQLDTAATVTIGHVGYLPLAPSALIDSSVTPPTVREYKSPFEMSLAFEQLQIDGCFGYRRMNFANASAQESQSAPFYVAMLPNPSREITRRGFLTTSLYYRLDPQRLPMYFDGDAIQPFHRLRDSDPLAPRPFPYSPSQGRTLLENVRSRSRTVSISVEHPILNAAAGYFADILSRDRFRTSIINDPRQADIRLVFIPLDVPELTTLRYVNGLLAADTVTGSPANETIRIIDGYLRTAATSTDPSMHEHYLMLAETSLRDDIGVLPLFRPQLFFVSRDVLIGSVFKADGTMDCSGLRKIRLPEPGECGR